MKLFKIMTAIAVLSLTSLSHAMSYYYKVMLSDEQMARHLDKYDTLKFFKYTTVYDEIKDKIRYEFPERYLLSENGITHIRFFLGERYTDEADWQLWMDRHDPNKVNIMTNSDKEKMIILISTITDDRQKAEQLFNELYLAYLERYEKLKDLPECKQYCPISVTIQYEDKDIDLHGKIDERNILQNYPENRHSIDIFFIKLPIRSSL
ncbi:hypothetical protein B5J94_08550 [Moraxella lacunata]|uniref:Uncharacterized protein n=3 Tax=Moraxella TaxID=475 RepID=A0A1V4GT97_MORLA|nr:hypothetical protein [Moraxella lacunata]OPH35852.1 hypothetical protein B5J94_08550 [Moraxella lacunata]